MNLKDYVIVSDFDGTITLQDSNSLLVEVLGDERNTSIEQAFISGITGSKETFTKHFETLGITMEEYYNFLKEYIDLDSDFERFLRKVRKEKIPFYIVSAGFRQGIEYILMNSQVKKEEIFANDLIEEGCLIPKFAIENPPCIKAAGACGNCKRISLQSIRKKTKKKIVFIGDGITDSCAAGEADLLFAKDYLEDYCKKNKVDYIPFQRFSDVEEYLFG